MMFNYVQDILIGFTISSLAGTGVFIGFCIICFYLISSKIFVSSKNSFLLAEWPFLPFILLIQEQFSEIENQVTAESNERQQIGEKIQTLDSKPEITKAMSDLIIVPFHWVHVCVTVVIIAVLVLIIGTVISTARQLKKIQVRPVEEHDSLKFQLTVKTLTYQNRWLWFFFFLEVINPVNWTRYIYAYNGLLVSTNFIALCVCVLLLGIIFINRLLLEHIKTVKINAIDFPVTALFILFFLLLIVYSNNFVIFFIGLEGLSLALCISLILLSDSNFYWGPFLSFNNSTKEKEGISRFYKPAYYYNILYNMFLTIKIQKQKAIISSLFYFLLNSFVSIIFALSLFFLLFFYRTLAYEDLYFEIGESILVEDIQVDFQLAVVLILLIVLFCFKLGLVPFHFWLPSVYSGANYFVIFILAVPVKIALMVIFLKLFFMLFMRFSFFWGPIFLIIGVLSMVVGAIGLFTQVEIKKFLAFSTLNHFGNMFIALGTGTFAGQQAILLYFLIYILMTMGFLLFVISVIRSDTNKSVLTINELASPQFLGTLPQVAFAIILLSMLGLPPFLGFWGKYLVFISLIGLNSVLGYFLIGSLVLTSVIAAYSYLNILKILFIRADDSFSLSNSEKYFILPFPIFNLVSLYSICFVLIFGGLLSQHTFFIDLFSYICDGLYGINNTVWAPELLLLEIKDESS